MKTNQKLSNTVQSPLFYDLRNYPKVLKVYLCHYTEKLVSEVDAIWVGGIIPQANIKYAHASGYKPLRELSVRDFNDMDANCNTCTHLERVKYEKSRYGWLYGKCKSTPINQLHCEEHNIMFHPNDCMMMSCYKQRPLK